LPDDFLPIARPDISEEDIAEVVDTLRSGWLSYGPRTQRFESEFKQIVGAEHAVAVTSCTAGLHLSLLAAGVGPGDEVITSPLTFAATANVIVHVGATPVLADISYDDLNIDPEQIEQRITPQTKAIMPVHYAGVPCRMDAIMEIARQHNLFVIEDAATAAGTAYKGRPIGSWGDMTSFSFYPVKNMTTGSGGMITTDDASLAEQLGALRNHGLDSNAWKRYTPGSSQPFYTLSSPGFNYYMFDLIAALGLGQLARLAQFNAKRARLAEHYTRLLSDIEAIETPTVSPDATSNWHLYVIRLRLEQLSIDRNQFVDELKIRGVGSAVHYYPVHYHPYYRENFGFKKGDYPVTEAEFDRIISLPLFPLMGESDVERVAGAIEEIVGKHHA
jgi:dTDP-4-amino-4,6-dideoxygalactose transaminase